MADGRLNRLLGWTLLIAGFAVAIWLDPWSASERDPAIWSASPAMYARHGQAVVVGMAFLQITLSLLLAAGQFRYVGSTATLLSAGGSLLYLGGYLSWVVWPAGPWLSVVGATLNFAAFVLLAIASFRRPTPVPMRIELLVLGCGMILAGVMAFFVADLRFWPEYLGAEDGVRMRMLRLARVAVIALTLLTILAAENAKRSASRLARWGVLALLVGAVGMPLVLTLAAFTFVELKYLLPIPAQATFIGALINLWLTWSSNRRLATWGWLLVATGMASGLLMGLYAFDGPLPAPEMIGAYNDFPRRCSRLIHAYCIVLGLSSICLDRSPPNAPAGSEANVPNQAT